MRHLGKGNILLTKRLLPNTARGPPPKNKKQYPKREGSRGSREKREKGKRRIEIEKKTKRRKRSGRGLAKRRGDGCDGDGDGSDVAQRQRSIRGEFREACAQKMQARLAHIRSIGGGPESALCTRDAEKAGPSLRTRRYFGSRRGKAAHFTDATGLVVYDCGREIVVLIYDVFEATDRRSD